MNMHFIKERKNGINNLTCKNACFIQKKSIIYEFMKFINVRNFEFLSDEDMHRD